MKNFLLNAISIVMGLSVITWLGTSILIPLNNIYGEPSEGLLNTSTWSLVITGGMALINFFVTKNKLKTRIMGWFKKSKTPKTPKKPSCSKCQKKKESKK